MKVKIQFIYKTPKGTSSFFSSDEMNAEKALLLTEDLEKTGRAKEIKFIDNQDNNWNIKELKMFLKEVDTEPHNITIYFDGGFDKQLKRSGLGCVIYYEQNRKSFRIRKNALVEGIDSNNEAEYSALHLALKELEYLGVHHLPVNIVGDSQVVINQLSEEWPTYEEELLNWADRIDKKLANLGITPVFKLVSRKENKEADQLASQALNNIEIISKSEVN